MVLTMTSNIKGKTTTQYRGFVTDDATFCATPACLSCETCLQVCKPSSVVDPIGLRKCFIRRTRPPDPNLGRGSQSGCECDCCR